MSDLKTILQTAINIAHSAGELLLEGFTQEKEIEIKSSSSDWVTQFDKAAEDLITTRLKAAFPEHGIVGEEGSRHQVERPFIWHIDPLDGTTNYAHNLPQFCVSMGLYHQNQPCVAVIYDPIRDECFHAMQGHGAHLTRGGQTTSLQVSQTENLAHCILATGFPYDKHISLEDNLRQMAAMLKRIQGIRRMGSAALDLAYVAAGRFDGYWEYKLNSWDIAAGVLLIQEAGGRVTAIDGQPFVLQPKVNLIASNGRIQQSIEQIVNH